MTVQQKTVLIVEDEWLVRMNALEMIESAGWRALEAANAAEALAVLAEHPAVDVLFTDINMPGRMDGLELAQRVFDEHPHIELVVTSGKHLLAGTELPDHGTFLPKPYGFQQLTNLIDSKTRPAA